jgi:hypothetical protein
MESHLEQGGNARNEAVSVWRTVGKAPRAGSGPEPPPETPRIPKAAYASSVFAFGQGQTRTSAELLFDSFSQPVVQGARSAAGGARHLLYRADPYQIDLQIQMGADRHALAITGQVLDLRQPELLGHGVSVVISNRSGDVVCTMTNQFGEFRNEIPNSGNLELEFPELTQQPVVIALRDPLDQSSTKSHARSDRIKGARSKRRKKT